MTTYNATTTFIGFRLRVNGPGAEESAPYARLPSMTPARIGNVIQHDDVGYIGGTFGSALDPHNSFSRASRPQPARYSPYWIGFRSA
jgi:hypothetical protein